MPLMGAQGPGSNISWRGNLDEYPDSFGFVDTVDQWPGIAVTSNSQTITGINYKALVTAVETSSNGIGCSVSINGADYVDANDPNNPVIIRNNDTVQFQIRTIENRDRFDYNRSYNIDISIGKRGPEPWLVRTRELDDDPIPFFFDDISGLEVSVGRTSNEIQVQDIDGYIGVDTLITTTGIIYVNGVNVGNSTKVLNNDYIYLENDSSGFYSTTVPTTLSLGSYTTTWNLTTREADDEVNPFTFTPIDDVDPETTHESNSITLSGADPNVNNNNPLNTTILGGEFKVVRGGVLERDYSSDSFDCQNGDVITVRGTASAEYSTDQNVTLNVNGVIGTYVITTRPTPIKTIPSPFSFVDEFDVERTNTLNPPENRIDSGPVTLTGMTEAPDDFGTASITGNGGDGSRAQFKVVRNGQTIRDFGTANFQVRNGDQIYLRIISSPNSLGQVTATFTVSGTNTFDVIAGVPGSISDTWFVRSAERFCNITSFSLPEYKNADPGKEYSRTFTAEGFDKDCGCTVTSSDTTNSYFKVNGVKKGASANVLLGDTVEIVMICPYYDQVRTTTVTLASSYSTQKQALFRITPKAPPLPQLTLDADPRSVPFIFPNGGNSTLRYTYNYVTNASVTTNFGVSSVSVNTLTSGARSGSKAVNNVPETTTYTMTVSNSTGSTTKTVELIVGDPPTPTASLCPSNTSSCSSTSKLAYGSSVTLYWKTQYATSISSSDFNTGNNQNGSVRFTNLTQDNKTYTVTATGPGGTVNASHTIDLTPTVDIRSDVTTLRNGDSTTLRWSSNLATAVVSSSGFNASGRVSGTLTISPRTTTTYSITVRDAAGNQFSDSVRVNVFDDRTVYGFSFSPSSVSNQERGSVSCSTPVFQTSGSVVGGLSPGVSVNATVSGGTFASGGTSRTVQNGTSANDLRVCIRNSNNFGETRCATLNINGVTAQFCSRTRECTVQNSSSSVSGGGQSATLQTRRAQGCVNEFAVIGVSGGTGAMVRGSGGSVTRAFGPGDHRITLPPNTNYIWAGAIGGGGGGGSDNGCATDAGPGGGGGGAGWGAITGNYGGQTLRVVVGRGGQGSRGDGRAEKGNNTVIRVNGNIGWRGDGGQGGSERGGPGAGGCGGGPWGGVCGRSGDNTSGKGSKRGGGGGGAGLVNGGRGGNGARGCNNPWDFGSGAQGGQGGWASGGGGEGGAGGECNSSCGSRGGNGGRYGGGGGGGANGSRGGRGADGRARVEYRWSAPSSDSLSNVVRTISRAYWDKGNRPATPGEVSSWVNAYVRNTTWNTTTLYNSINPGRCGGSTTDNCGNAFPRFR